MNGHLVTVKVGVKAFANQRMDANGIAFDKGRLEGLDTHAMERGRAV